MRTALPATKISPMYLQQQFFQQLKQQMAQIAAIKRSSSPSLMNQARPPPQTTQTQAQIMNRVPSGIASKPPTNKAPTVSNTMRSSQQSVNPTAPTSIETASIETSLDIFDSFSDFELAYYRLNVIKPLLNRLLESTTTSTAPATSTILPEGLEADLIAATKKKISSLQERSETFKTSQKESLQHFKSDQKLFWDTFAQLEKSPNPDLIYKQFLQSNDYSMDQDIEVSYTSL